MRNETDLHIPSGPIPQEFQLHLNPIPDPEAVIEVGEARFTILTDRLVRMEFAPGANFEERASQAFWYRQQPVPEYQANLEEDRLEIRTQFLLLKYDLGCVFSADSLSIELRETSRVWRFGMADKGNLRGTVRTLDRMPGPVPLQQGLVSRSGWAIVDDSRSLVFDSSSWITTRDQPDGAFDLYFFGYGNDYERCIQDYLRISGRVPLIPRWSLGNWWSRYWEYTQQELTDLMLEFRERDIPLSVCIVDMDWHITDTGNQSTGWTGYTWNRDLFPDPPEFLRVMHELGLRVSLNLHPAEGIHPHEEMYPEMARRMGINPQSGEPVSFDLSDQQFARAYFELLHHPQEELGVDFWWLDWQQGTRSRMEGLDPLWWLNHLHALDRTRDGRRPFLFSRWGGLGNHRYPIGFSGDTQVTWDALAFQPYLTATAANVAYHWWSHDIGGHFMGEEDRELYLRWLQYGVLSPILRLHSTKNPYHERRPWGYDAEILVQARRAMQLRHALIPYIYSMAWKEATEGIPLIRPLYHLYPETEEAYACVNQYTFGSELIGAPFITPLNPKTRLARQIVWLPEGKWYTFIDSRRVPSGWNSVYGSLGDIPIFAKAGAIVPLAALGNWSETANPKNLEVHVFPGESNEFVLYEDDGSTLEYRNGKYALTPLQLVWEEDSLTFTIGPTQGELSLVPEERRWDVFFHGVTQACKVAIDIPSDPPEELPAYDPEAKTLMVSGLTLLAGDKISVQVKCEEGNLEDPPLQDPTTQVLRMLKAFRLPTMTKTVLASRVKEWMAETALLSAFDVSLEAEQKRALLEAVTGAGIASIRTSGEEILLLWNREEREGVFYNLTVHHPDTLDQHRHLAHEGGQVPHSRIFRPEREFNGDPWRVRFWHSGDEGTTLRGGAEPMEPGGIL